MNLRSADAVIESTVIRDVRSPTKNAYGILAHAFDGDRRTALTFSASIIEQTEIGLQADGAVVTVDSAVVRDNDLNMNSMWNGGM